MTMFSLFCAFAFVVLFSFGMMYKSAGTINIIGVWADGCVKALDSDVSLYIGNPWYRIAHMANKAFGRKVAVIVTTAVLSVAAIAMWLAEAAIIALVIGWVF